MARKNFIVTITNKATGEQSTLHLEELILFGLQETPKEDGETNIVVSKRATGEFLVNLAMNKILTLDFLAEDLESFSKNNGGLQ